MAITNTKNNTALVIKYTKGQNQDGSPKFQIQKFSKISVAATDEEVYNLGVLIGSVLISEPTEIKKLDDYTLNQG
jgi:hypothetical protein